MMDIDAQYQTATKAQASGELELAALIYRQILEQRPDHVPAQRKLAIAMHRQGNCAGAVDAYRQYLELRPGDSSIHGNLGLALRDCGRIDEAIVSLERALELNDENADAQNTLGTIHQSLGRYREAETCYRRAVVLDDRALHYSNLGQALYLQGKLEDALSSFQAAAERDGADAAVWEYLGQVCTALRNFPRAVDAFERSLRLDPDRCSTSALLADLYERSHDEPKAAACAQAALRMDPSQPLAHLVLSRIDRRNGNIEAARRRLEIELRRREGRIADTDGTSIRFELGLVLDRLGEHEKAYGRICEAKANQVRQLGRRVPSRRILLRQIERQHGWVTSERVAGWCDESGETSSSVVFFVGFPRSGTTLVEQILASHHEVVTTDEQHLLREVKRRCAEMAGPGATYPECLDALGDGQIETLRQHYLELAERALGASVTGKRLVDKLPLNLIELPLVRRVFPKSKVLVALRDPRDVCISCFMHHFEVNEATIHFSDLGSTAELYGTVMGLWLHFRKALGLDWMEYRYEDLVDDTEKVARRILAFIGLDWDPGVLAYTEAASRKVISTPSYQDVTRPVYRRALSRWKSYEAHLLPHMDRLAPYIDEFYSA